MDSCGYIYLPSAAGLGEDSSLLLSSPFSTMKQANNEKQDLIFKAFQCNRSIYLLSNCFLFIHQDVPARRCQLTRQTHHIRITSNSEFLHGELKVNSRYKISLSDHLMFQMSIKVRGSAWLYQTWKSCSATLVLMCISYSPGDR